MIKAITIIFCMLSLTTAAQLKDDTVKIKATCSSWFIGNQGIDPAKPWTTNNGKTLTEGLAIIVRGYAVYSRRYDQADIDPGFYRRNQPNIIRELKCLLSTNKKDTLKYVFDYKEMDWK